MKRRLLHGLLGCSTLLVVGCSAKSPPVPASETPRSPAPAAPAAGSPSHVVTEHFHSDALGVDKDVVVYVPRGYDAQPAKHWPVFYYLHGLTGDETNWVKNGKLDAAADQLALAAIVVMPDGDDDFYVDSPAAIDYAKCMASGDGLFTKAPPFAKACVHQRNYEAYIAKDLVGWVDAHYRTIQRRDGRAIAGLSMGGFGAMAISLRHPDEFAAAASHSGAIAMMFRGPRPFVADQPVELMTSVGGEPAGANPIVAWIGKMFGRDIAEWKAHDVVELASKLPTGTLALYFDCGTEDDFNLQDNVQYVHAALTARHIEHEFFVGPGKHNFELWTQRLPHSLAFLAAHTAKPE